MELGQQMARFGRAALGMRGIQCRNDSLLDFCTGESIRVMCEPRQVHLCGIESAVAHVNLEDLATYAGAGQIDKEDFVETTFAN